MPDSGFEVELDKLELVGGDLLPKAADMFWDAKSAMAEADSAGSFGGDTFSRLDTPMRKISAQFAYLFEEIAKELELAGEATLQVAQRYREADGQETSSGVIDPDKLDDVPLPG